MPGRLVLHSKHRHQSVMHQRAKQVPDSKVCLAIEPKVIGRERGVTLFVSDPLQLTAAVGCAAGFLEMLWVGAALGKRPNEILPRFSLGRACVVGRKGNRGQPHTVPAYR